MLISPPSIADCCTALFRRLLPRARLTRLVPGSQVVHLHSNLHCHDQPPTMASMVLAAFVCGTDHPLRPMAEHPYALLQVR